MKKIALVVILLSLFANAQKTHFQTAGTWHPELDFNTDAVLVYGSFESFIGKSRSWKAQGYEIQSMMSSSWGHNEFFKDLDLTRPSENPYAQRIKNGDVLMHGKHQCYIVPDSDFTNYLKENISKIIDAGASAIYLEEPEYFSHAGYSEIFKKKWSLTYAEPWVDQYASAGDYYKSALLKSDFYFHHLKELSEHIKSYSNGKVKCYIPTHSILNYSLWRIISPEIRLNALESIDGYIGQVWTGTARTPIYYNGIYKERTFENAYLEYASLRAMAKSGNKDIYFLTDPIEDAIDHTWADYIENYHKTFVAQMMFSDIDKFEVMPWPDRIFFNAYPNESGGKSRIPKDYATELSILINVMRNIGVDDFFQGYLGVLLSNTLMYQSNYGKEGYEDARSSNFYGLALPVLKHGIRPNIVFLEAFKESIADTKVLLMTYENMKPLKKEYHNAIADWVKKGGVLLYFGENGNTFNTIGQWWNMEGYDSPSDHLFGLLGIDSSLSGLQNIGQGKCSHIVVNPDEYVLKKKGDDSLMKLLKSVFGQIGVKWNEKNYIVERRGAYIATAAMDEGPSEEPCIKRGRFVNLFDASLPIMDKVVTKVNEVNFVYDLNKIPEDSEFEVIASSSRIVEKEKTGLGYVLKIRGASSAEGIMRFFSKKSPKEVILNTKRIKIQSDEFSTYLIRFANNAEINTLKIMF